MKRAEISLGCVAASVAVLFVLDRTGVVTSTGDLPAGDLIVGLGTALLAGFTYYLARETRATVEAAGDELEASRAQAEASADQAAASATQAQATRELVDAQDRPYLMPSAPLAWGMLANGNEGFVPNSVGEVKFVRTGPDWRFLIQFWNVGNGAAIVNAVRLTLDPTPANYLLAIGSEFAVAHPEGKADLDFKLDSNRGDPPSEGADFTLTIEYRDMADREHKAIATVRVMANHVCQVVDVRQVRPG